MTRAPSIAQFALSYVGLGWSVIPVHAPRAGTCSCGRAECPAPGKHPRIPWEEHTRRRARAEEVVEWWRRWPDANVGVVTGRVSELVVIDVDPRHGGETTLSDLERERGGLPTTVASRTGGGGTHVWLGEGEPTGALPSTVMGAGLERKADGAAVVAPPSLHASGGRYTWLKGRAPWEAALVTAPDWVVEGGSRRAPAGERLTPIRTPAEQEEFARSWREVDIELLSGDRYYRCPFHDDRHPSLHVDAEGCRWYCFGCGRGGGIGSLRRLLGHIGPRRELERVNLRRGGGTPVTIRGETEVPVVGEGRHQDELLALTGGQRRYGGSRVDVVAALEPEPDNRFDPDAVAVSIDGAQVGYLRHEDAVAYRALIERARDREGRATCEGLIRGGWDRGHDDVGAFGVVLVLPPLD